MKKLLLSLAIAAVATSSAMADYNIAALSYDNVTINSNSKAGKPFIKEAKNGDVVYKKNGSFNGLGLEYIHGFGISKLPMYIEVGGKVSFTFNHKSVDFNIDDDVTATATQNWNLIRLAIPVSYAYRFKCGDNFAVTPYLGLDFRFNLAASLSEKWKMVEYDPDGSEEYESDDDPTNLFSKDDMYGHTWNRFQMGWHIGVRAEYSRFSLGLNLGTDFMPIYKFEKAKMTTFNLSLALGYRF